MSLSVLQSTRAMSPNLTTPFGANGGTEPYSYSVLPGGAGGSIDSVTGLYTSPGSYGTDTIEVTDSVSAIATSQIGILPPLLLVCDIIQTAMGLQNGQVYEYNQKINIPTDSKIYIAVGIQSCKPFGNRPKYVGTSGTLTAVQSVNMQATVSIDIFSRSNLALNQKEQVLLALSSPYSQQQMELNSFSVAPLTTSFVNLSSLDGAAIPYRFQTLVNMTYFSTLTTSPDYFTTFSNVAITTES